MNRRHHQRHNNSFKPPFRSKNRRVSSEERKEKSFAARAKKRNCEEEKLRKKSCCWARTNENDEKECETQNEKKSEIEGRAAIIRDYISFLLLFSSSPRALARTHRDSLAIHAKIHDVADDSESTRMCKRNSKEFTRDAFFVHSLCTLLHESSRRLTQRWRKKQRRQHSHNCARKVPYSVTLSVLAECCWLFLNEWISLLSLS